MAATPDRNKSGKDRQGMSTEKNEGPSVGHPEAPQNEVQADEVDEFRAFDCKVLIVIGGTIHVEFSHNGEDAQNGELRDSDVQETNVKPGEQTLHIKREALTQLQTSCDAHRAHDKLISQPGGGTYDHTGDDAS